MTDKTFVRGYIRYYAHNQHRQWFLYHEQRYDTQKDFDIAIQVANVTYATVDDFNFEADILWQELEVLSQITENKANA